MTKLIVSISALSFLVLFSACKKTNEVVKVSVPLTTTVSFIIPEGQNATDTTIAVYWDIDSAIQAVNPAFNGSNLKSVTALPVSCTLLNADNTDNFGNLGSVSVLVASTENTTPVSFAQITNNPSDFLVTLSIPPTNKELKGYFYSKIFYFTFSGIFSSPTFVNLNNTAILKFTAIVGPN